MLKVNVGGACDCEGGVTEEIIIHIISPNTHNDL